MIKVHKDKIKAVVTYLEQKFQEEGRDYYFKSKRLSKEIDIPAHTIGRVAMLESINGGPVTLVRQPGHGACLFRTNFKEISIGH
jgi:hypothetical protein